MKKNKKSVTFYAGSGVYLALLLRELNIEIPDYAVFPLACLIFIPLLAVGITYFFMRQVDKYNQTQKYRQTAKIIVPFLCAILSSGFAFTTPMTFIFPIESFLVSWLYLKEYEKITNTLPKPKDFKKPEVVTEYQSWIEKKVRFLFWNSTVGINYLIILGVISLLLFLDDPKDLNGIFSIFVSMGFINFAHFFISTNKKLSNK